MPTLFMLRGLPASGKTTIARKMVSERGCKRVNRDDLRAMLDNGKYGKLREFMVKDIRNAIITLVLWQGYDVVVDDTNLKPEDEEGFRRMIAPSDRIGFQVIDVDTPLEECIRRDAGRENPVGEKVIRDMYEKYVKKVEA